MTTAFTEFLGSAVGNAAGYAAGRAVGPVLTPLLQELRNETWHLYPDAPLDALLLARAVAEGKLLKDTDTYDEASFTGISRNRFDSLVLAVQVGPGVAAAQDLVRRGILDGAGFKTALTRAGLEDQWIGAYLKQGANGVYTWQTYLTPEQMALGLVRGNLETFTAPSGPAFPTGLSSAGSNVPPDPVLGLDVVTEAAAAGLDADRMALLARNVGLPPGVIEGLRMYNRGIINKEAFALLIEQSDARLSWGPFLFELHREILTPHEYVEGRLRGWIQTDAEMLAGTALSGLNAEDSHLLYLITGRPISYRNVFVGERRGGVYDGPTDVIEPSYLKSLQESNLRPEWYNIAWALRFTQPTLFFVRTWLKDGHPQDQARTWLSYLGYSQGDIDAIVLAYAKPATATTDPHVRSAVTAAYAALRKLYVNNTYTEAQVTAFDTQLVDAQKATDPLIAVLNVLRTIENPPPQPVAP